LLSRKLKNYLIQITE